MTSVTQATSKANDGFGMDVLLANWDVVGMNNDNMLKTADGKIIRLDAGGTFDYRAQGKNKPYTSIPMEFVTLMDSNINSKSAQIFAKMTRDDLINSLNKVANLKTTEITNLLDSMGLSHYKEPLLNRKKFLKSLLEEIKANPQGSESTLEYMHKMMNKSLDNAISSAKSATELQDIKQALTYVNNPKTKQHLLDNIAIKEKVIAASAPAPKFLSEVQVQNLLAKNGFVQNSGYWQKTLDQATKDKLYNQYGSYSSKIIHKIEATLSIEDIKKLQTIMNAGNGQFINVWQNDMNNLILLYRNIENTNIFSYLNDMGTGEWETLVNIAKNPISEDTLSSIQIYKGSGYSSINHALENMHKKGIPYPANVADDIKKIQAYLNTQVIHSQITIKRNEGYEVLHSVTLPNGKHLDDAMQEAVAHFNATKGDRTKINEVRKMVLGQISVAHQEHFMSATIAGPAPFASSPVHWDFKVEQGSKGVLLEGVNPSGAHQNETEILLQKDSKITITAIDYKNGKWQLEGNIKN